MATEQKRWGGDGSSLGSSEPRPISKPDRTLQTRLEAPSPCLATSHLGMPPSWADQCCGCALQHQPSSYAIDPSPIQQYAKKVREEEGTAPTASLGSLRVAETIMSMVICWTDHPSAVDACEASDLLEESSGPTGPPRLPKQPISNPSKVQHSLQSTDTIRQNRPPTHVVVVSMMRKYVIVTARPQELECRCKVPVASASHCKAPAAQDSMQGPRGCRGTDGRST